MSHQRPDRIIKPVDEMANDLSNEKATMIDNPKTRYPYKSSSPENDHKLSVAIKTRCDSLRNNPATKVDFRDIEDVKRRTFDYLDACSIASVYPTMLGLAVHGFGVAKQTLYYHLNAHPDDESTQFLRMVSDLLADILINDSLKRRCDCVSAIFVLKNLYGFRDNIDPPLSDVVDDRDVKDVGFYRRKYGDLVDD